MTRGGHFQIGGVLFVAALGLCIWGVWAWQNTNDDAQRAQNVSALTNAMLLDIGLAPTEPADDADHAPQVIGLAVAGVAFISAVILIATAPAPKPTDTGGTAP